MSLVYGVKVKVFRLFTVKGFSDSERLLGITGKNVVVAILDDGLDMESEDLKDNFASIYTVEECSIIIRFGKG